MHTIVIPFAVEGEAIVKMKESMALQTLETAEKVFTTDWELYMLTF